MFIQRVTETKTLKVNVCVSSNKSMCLLWHTSSRWQDEHKRQNWLKEKLWKFQTVQAYILTHCAVACCWKQVRVGESHENRPEMSYFTPKSDEKMKKL